MTIVLRPYQEQGLADIRAAYREVKSVLYCLPTGGGKTALFTAIAQGASEKGKRILILVHRNELLTQARAKLTDLGVRSGIIKGSHKMELAWHVQVGSIQSVARRLESLPEPQLIICDEGHHAASTSYRKVFDHWPKAGRLLVTATPERLDGRGLGNVAQRMIQGPDMRTLIQQGYLSKPVVYSTPKAPDTSSLHTVAGDYDMHEAETMMDTPFIIGDAIAQYRKLCDGKPALAFCTSLAHAEHVAAQFREAGYRAALIEGKHTDDERRQMLQSLADGRLHVLTSVSLIGEGVDVPIVEASILLRPTKSVAVYLQQVGRCMRVYPGKQRALVLDHVGAWLEHGLPTAARAWSLEGRKKGKKTKVSPLRQCPHCWCTHEPAPICPECGHVYLTAMREGPQEVEGELEEITDEMAALNAADLRKDQRREEGMARTLEDLQAIGRKRGYSPQWAHVRWSIRQRKAQGPVRADEVHMDSLKSSGILGMDVTAELHLIAQEEGAQRVDRRGQKLAYKFGSEE